MSSYMASRARSHKRPWRARIIHEGQIVYIEHFAEKAEADQAEREERQRLVALGHDLRRGVRCHCSGDYWVEK